MHLAVRVKPPLSFIFYENFITCAKEINCFCILFACLFFDLMQILGNGINLHANFKEHCKWAKK